MAMPFNPMMLQQALALQNTANGAQAALAQQAAAAAAQQGQAVPAVSPQMAKQQEVAQMQQASQPQNQVQQSAVEGGLTQAQPNSGQNMPQEGNWWSNFLNRLQGRDEAGNLLTGQALKDWQGNVGLSSLLTQLGARIAGPGHWANTLGNAWSEGMQGLQMGSNAQQMAAQKEGVAQALGNVSQAAQTPPAPQVQPTQVPEAAKNPLGTSLRGTSSLNYTPGSSLTDIDFGSLFYGLGQDPSLVSDLEDMALLRALGA